MDLQTFPDKRHISFLKNFHQNFLVVRVMQRFHDLTYTLRISAYTIVVWVDQDFLQHAEKLEKSKVEIIDDVEDLKKRMIQI